MKKVETRWDSNPGGDIECVTNYYPTDFIGNKLPEDFEIKNAPFGMVILEGVTEIKTFNY